MGELGHRRRAERVRRPRWRAYRWAAGYALRQRRRLILIGALTLVNSFVAALAPVPLKVAIDNGLGDQELSPFMRVIAPSGERALIVWSAAVLVLLGAASTMVSAALSRLWTLAGNSVVRDMTIDTFERLQRLSLRFHRRRPVGDSLERVMTDTWAGYAVMQSLFIGPPTQLLTAVGVVIAASRINARLTLVLLLTTPLIVYTARRLGTVIKSRSDTSRAADGLFTAMVHRTLASLPLIRSFGAEDQARARFTSSSLTTIKAAERSSLGRGLAEAVPGTVNTSGRALIVALGALAVLDGELSLGALLAFMTYSLQLQAATSALLETHRSLRASESNIERVLEVVECGEVIVERRDPLRLGGPLRGHVRFEHVSFSYEAGQEVLSDVCVDIEPGETVALVGATGSGKTTLVSLLPRFMDPTGGRVTVDGFDVRDLALADLRRNIAIVRQDPLLLPTTIAQNIAFARPDATFDEVRAAARAANATEFIDRLPEGFETVVGERGDTLSGGQKQRIAIARALLKDAPVLVLDEPTSALDPQTEHLLVVALERLTRNRTVIVIAHRESTIAHADRVVTLDRGRLTTPTAA